MVPKSQAIVGMEIGERSVRAVKTDREAALVEDYAEVSVEVNPSEDGDIQKAYQQAIESTISQFDLGDPETYRLGVAFSDVNAGVGSGGSMETWLAQQVEKLDVSFVYIGGQDVSFAPDNSVSDVLALFRPSGIGVSRMELAPVAAARVLPESLTCQMTLGSGVGWQADIRNGRVFSAYANTDIGRDQPLKLAAEGATLPPVTTLRDVKVPDSLLAEHSIPVSKLCPAAGVAKAIANREEENLLYGEKIIAASEEQRRQASKKETGKVQAVPKDVALAGPAAQTKTTMFQPLQKSADPAALDDSPSPPMQPADKPVAEITETVPAMPSMPAATANPAATDSTDASPVADLLQGLGDTPLIPAATSSPSPLRSTNRKISNQKTETQKTETGTKAVAGFSSKQKTAILMGMAAIALLLVVVILILP